MSTAELEKQFVSVERVAECPAHTGMPRTRSPVPLPTGANVKCKVLSTILREAECSHMDECRGPDMNGFKRGEPRQ